HSALISRGHRPLRPHRHRPRPCALHHSLHAPRNLAQPHRPKSSHPVSAPLSFPSWALNYDFRRARLFLSNLFFGSDHAMASPFLRLSAAATLATFLPTFLTAQTVVRCDSKGPRKVCPTNPQGGVSLRYQYSDEGCWQNNTW